MRLAIVAAVAVLVAPASAAADSTGGAMDLTLGGVTLAGDAADAATSAPPLYLRLAGGVQRGRLAIEAFYEQVFVEPTDVATDSTSMFGPGVGLAARIHLRRSPGLLVDATLGWSFRWLLGSGDVLRTCRVHGGCDAGFYHESPSYASNAPFAAVTVGWRPRGRVYPLVGVELGVGELELDRPGAAPDAAGPMVWLGLKLGLGSGLAAD